MPLGYIGLIITFLIISLLLSWIIIYKSKISIYFKVGLLFVVVWYGLVLFYIPMNFAGWPATSAVFPETGIVVSVFVKYPILSDKGAGYIWLLEEEDARVYLSRSIDPGNNFNYGKIGDPRAYKIPYSKAMEKMMQRANEAMDEGKLIRFKRYKSLFHSNERFKLEEIDPKEFLIKTE